MKCSWHPIARFKRLDLTLSTLITKGMRVADSTEKNVFVWIINFVLFPVHLTHDTFFWNRYWFAHTGTNKHYLILMIASVKSSTQTIWYFHFTLCIEQPRSSVLRDWLMFDRSVKLCCSQKSYFKKSLITNCWSFFRYKAIMIKISQHKI